FFVMLDVIPRHSRKPILTNERRDVSRQHEAIPINDWVGGGGCAEARGPANHPCGQYSAAAASGHKEIVPVDVTLCDHRVNSGVQVEEIVARVLVMNEISELAAVAGTASRIRVQDHVIARGPDLLFNVEPVTVVGKGAAMNFDYQGILL